MPVANAPFSQYIPRPMSSVTKAEHKRRLGSIVPFETLPKSMGEMKALSFEEQLKVAKVFFILVKLFEYEQDDFIQEILVEYEWPLSDLWYYTCNECGFPNEFCGNS